LKAVGDLLAFVIVSTVVLSITLAIFFATMIFNEMTRATLEYGSVKSVFKDIAVKFDSILTGTRLMYGHPSDFVGIGYRRLETDITIAIQLQNGTVASMEINGFYAIQAVVHKILIEANKVIYGSTDSRLVDRLNNAVVLREYTSNGSTVLEMTSDKIYYSIYNITENARSVIVVELVIARIVKPYVVGSGTLVVYSRVNETLSTTYESVQGFTIAMNGDMLTSDQLLSECIGQSVDSVNLHVRVVDVVFEIY